MTEEITAALAKVPDLRVVARTSAFEFKGKSVNIKTMGQELGATHLIEGSVRKAGNRVRITAQLIKADDGTHIWAEDYDRGRPIMRPSARYSDLRNSCANWVWSITGARAVGRISAIPRPAMISSAVDCQ
jgi:hypothetical protein